MRILPSHWICFCIVSYCIAQLLKWVCHVNKSAYKIRLALNLLNRMLRLQLVCRIHSMPKAIELYNVWITTDERNNLLDFLGYVLYSFIKTCTRKFELYVGITGQYLKPFWMWKQIKIIKQTFREFYWNWSLAVFLVRLKNVEIGLGKCSWGQWKWMCCVTGQVARATTRAIQIQHTFRFTKALNSKVKQQNNKNCPVLSRTTSDAQYTNFTAIFFFRMFYMVMIAG